MTGNSRMKIYFLFIILMFTTSANSQTIPIKILGINDFHGQITTERRINNRPVGGAAVLAAYVKAAQNDNTIIALSGDQIGASIPASGLLRDEPTIIFLNSLANQYCKERFNPRCNMVATIGNHEFDRGQETMLNILYGAHQPPTDNWISLAEYPGAVFPFISANIMNTKTHKLIFPPYVIKKVHDIPIAFIGVISKNAPATIFADNIVDIEFQDEAQAVNRYIPEIKAQGVKIIIVVMHEGGKQTAYEGDTKEETDVQGPIVDIIKNLDDVDVVMAGHTHLFLNAYLPNKNGKKILVTEANLYSTALAEISLLVDSKSKSIIKKSARIITTYADQIPGTNGDATAKEIVTLAEKKIEPIFNRQIGTITKNALNHPNAYGESDLGNLIADAYRHIMKTDIGICNLGSIRTDLFAGKVTWGTLYSILPFGNNIVITEMAGKDIYTLLEQQWLKFPIDILQISGLSYQYVAKNGEHIVAAFVNNKPLEKNKIYTIAVSIFLAVGGDNFTAFKYGKITKVGATDLEILIQYVKDLPQPFTATIDGRIKQIDTSNIK